MAAYLAHIKTVNSRVTTLRALVCDDPRHELRDCLTAALREWAIEDIEGLEVCDGPTVVLEAWGPKLQELLQEVDGRSRPAEP